MPPSPRLTIRLSPGLAARVAAHVGHGRSVSDIVRQALEVYLGGASSSGPTRQTPAADTPQPLADTPLPLSDILSDMLSDMSARLAAMEQRLTAIETALATVGQGPTRRPTPRQTRPTPPPPGVYDPDAAVARMEALHAEGRSLAQIAAQLTAEGLPTRHGKPWHKGTVGYLLKTYGQ